MVLGLLTLDCTDEIEGRKANATANATTNALAKESLAAMKHLVIVGKRTIIAADVFVLVFLLYNDDLLLVVSLIQQDA